MPIYAGEFTDWTCLEQAVGKGEVGNGDIGTYSHFFISEAKMVPNPEPVFLNPDELWLAES
jgi:hypothetical protein